MKISVSLCTALLLVAFVPRDDCRALKTSAASVNGLGQHSELQHLVRPVAIHFEEEYLQPQAKTDNNVPFDGTFKVPLARLQRILHGEVGDLDGVKDRYQGLVDETAGRGKRRDTPVLSLGVPLHILYKLIALAKAEKMVKQAEENRKILVQIGK
ncbi:corticoliberin-like [Narcine bancroftii]|uniref:corticoliberin-like n=1 Tax=Narcine bancroftii TaxID=1343680 RepID=UPI003831442C